MLDFKRAQKLEKGDILIAMDDSSFGGRFLCKYQTIEITSVGEVVEERDCCDEDEQYIKVSFKILSGNNKSDKVNNTTVYNWSNSIDIVKQNEVSIKEYYANRREIVKEEIDNLHKAIEKAWSRIYELDSNEIESLSVKNIDDFKDNKLGESLKTIITAVNSDEVTDYKALAGQLRPILKEVA